MTSYGLLLLAAVTGWLPVGGFPIGTGSSLVRLLHAPQYLVLPVLALVLPLAASLERLQAASVRDALAQPSIRAARARGLGEDRLLWKHAFRLSLAPLLSVYGVIGAAVLSGSFAVEVVMSWPGLGALMYEALTARDLYLVAGCALAVATLLAVSVLRPTWPCGWPIRGGSRSPDAAPRISAWLGLLLTVTGLTLAAPVLAPHDPATQHPGFILAPPMRPRLVDAAGHWRAPFVYPLILTDRLARSYARDETRPATIELFRAGRAASVETALWFPLGTDLLGRDVWSRLLYGARLSLGVAGLATAGALMLGILIGGLAGISGGLVDTFLTRTADLVIALPAIYVVLSLRAALPLVLSTSVLFWIITAVLWHSPAGRQSPAASAGSSSASAASSTQKLRGRSVSGCTRLLLRHLLPAAASFIAVQATVLLPAFIVAEATLSYVGLGFPSITPSWGVMLKEAAEGRLFIESPWLLTPAIAIAITVLSVNLLSARTISAFSGLDKSRK